MLKDVIEIEYTCDAMGDHRVPTDQCVTSGVRSFTLDQKDEARKFILECSHVYKLDETLKKLSHKESAINKEKA